MKIKAKTSLLALVLCMSALFMPMTVLAATGDTTPPTVEVVYADGRLTITATDDNSVDAVYIDGHRVNSLVNGAATVTLQDYAGNSQMVSVYAVDGAGNRSNTVQIDNPFYTAPVSSSRPSASSSVATSSTAPASSTSQAATSQSSSTVPAVSSSSSSAASDTSASESAGSGETAIPDGSNAFTPDGTGTVVDNATDADGKEFYTITTANGNVFYLVVDKERASDNVYFLNAVTESDLLALAEQDGVTVIPGESALPAEDMTGTNGLPEDSGEDEEQQEDEQAEEGGKSGMILFIVLVAAAVGGAGYYLKVVKPRQQTDLDYDEDEEEEYEDENAEDIDFEEESAAEYGGGMFEETAPQAYGEDFEPEFEAEGEE